MLNKTFGELAEKTIFIFNNQSFRKTATTTLINRQGSHTYNAVENYADDAWWFNADEKVRVLERA